MCNRYQQPDPESSAEALAADKRLSFNVAGPIIHPGSPGLAVRMQHMSRVLDQMHWGFPLQLAGASKPKPVNNTRFDKLGSGFWKQWVETPEQRCLIPVAAYAEAQGTKGRMTETWIAAKAGILAWAGLWRPTDVWGHCYSGVMTDAAPELAHIHGRMPVLLGKAEQELWLTATLVELATLDRPFTSTNLVVNSTTVLWAKPRQQ